MPDAWLGPDLFTVYFLGLGAVLLGLAGLLTDGALARRHWALAGPAVLTASAGVLAALGQPAGRWLPPLGLAAVWGLCRAARSPLWDRAWAALGPLRRPRYQGAALVLAGTSLVVAVACRDRPEPTIPDGAIPFPDGQPTEYRFEPHEQTWLRAVTDRGRPLHVFSQDFPSRMAPAVRAAEQHTFQILQSWGGLVRLASPTQECNCHGWVFLGGRFMLKNEDVELVLGDNGYQPVAVPRANDLAVYRDGQGQIQHSGVVLWVGAGDQVVIGSKWGDLGCYAHLPETPGYGRPTYYRSARSGHRVRGLDEERRP